MKRTDLANTRGQILNLLCSGNQTAGELAKAIGISRSAVHVHLGRLEEEGVVEHERVIRGVGKPTHRYRLTGAGEELLSRAYLPLADAFLSVTAARTEGREFEEILRAIGRRLVERRPRAAGDREERVRAAAGLLEGLGGSVEIVPSPGRFLLRGRCCPVAAIASEYPQVCTAIEEMLATYTGLPVRQSCDRGGRPSCRFSVPSATRAT